MTDRLVVLQSFQAPRPTTNPYIVMLARSIAAVPGVEVRCFSWRAALVGRYDVLHVHWPEVMLRGPGRLRTLRRRVLFAALLVRLGARGTPVVRTVHNLAPHDPPTRLEALLLRGLDRLTSAHVAINASTPARGRGDWAVIPHGHFRDWFAAYPIPATVPGRIANFGLIRPYKGVSALIRAYRAAVRTDPELTLSVAGNPSSDALAAELRALARGDEHRIDLLLTYVDDATLVDVIGAAELVALPYREMHNSGGVLTALSLDRPVLVPETEVNQLLAAEVGPGWVHLYRGELDASTLTGALAALRQSPPARLPDLSDRDWAAAGVRHVAVYRAALRRHRHAVSAGWRGRPHRRRTGCP